jgi:eukaryotic-like serine/threonine-protein kinase
MARATSTPPVIEGFTPVRLIGVGGYADVFLYEQQMPHRQVAVKVLIADLLSGDSQRKQFTAEANLMAKVSTHPYIVSVFQAAVAADRRPYIVMELYPGDNYLDRVRRERFGVGDALRTGIHIASAVETAHRAGILHRDIKPANILTSEYGRPGLTDFGIAAPDDQGGDENEGLSIPWAPPEAFGNDRLDERADVYSLAATVYHLLAGRSPFEVPGGSNSPLDLMSRIERAPVPGLGRPDVPASLERLLAAAMAKDPAHRPKSAAEFARQLQAVEGELKLAVTQLELADESRAVRTLDDEQAEDATRIRGVTTVDAQAVAPGVIAGVPERPTGVAPAPVRRREGMLAEPEVAATMARPKQAATPDDVEVEVGEAPRKRWMLMGAIAASIVVAVGSLVTLGGSGGSGVSSAGTDPIVVNDGFDDSPSVITPSEVSGLVGVDGGDGYEFSWSAPSDATGVRYQVSESEAGKQSIVMTTTYVSSKRCITVVAVRGDRSSLPVSGCAS